MSETPTKEDWEEFDVDPDELSKHLKTIPEPLLYACDIIAETITDNENVKDILHNLSMSHVVKNTVYDYSNKFLIKEAWEEIEKIIYEDLEVPKGGATGIDILLFVSFLTTLIICRSNTEITKSKELRREHSLRTNELIQKTIRKARGPKYNEFYHEDESINDLIKNLENKVAETQSSYDSEDTSTNQTHRYKHLAFRRDLLEFLDGMSETIPYTAVSIFSYLLYPEELDEPKDPESIKKDHLRQKAKKKP